MAVFVFRICCFALGAGLSWFFFFRLPRRLSGKWLLLALFGATYAAPLLFMLVCMGGALALQHLGMVIPPGLRDEITTALVAFAVPSGTALGANFFRLAAVGVENFHRTNNAQNLHRNPIRFFIRNRERLVRLACGLFFVGGLYMMAGALFFTPGRL